MFLMFPSKMVNTATFRTALKAVRKNCENMSSRIYQQDFSTIQNIRMDYGLYERLHGPERVEPTAVMSQ